MLLVVIGLVAAACGSGDRQGAVGGAPLLTPGEAEGRNGVLAVQGFLWARPGEGQFRLCEEKLEAAPPQCGEPAVNVTGIDLTDIAGIDFSQNVFSAEALRARGRLSNGTLAVEEIELNTKDARTGLIYRLVLPVEVDRGARDFIALLTNSSTVPVEVTFNSGQSADVTLLDTETGATVYTWSAARSFDQAVRRETINPGETIRYVLTEDQLDLPSGPYDVQSALTSPTSPGIVRGRLVVR